MGGKGAAPANNQMVEFEKEQAAEARQKEEERKQRLELGVKNIGEIFHGKQKTQPVAAKFDPSSLTGFQAGPVSTTKQNIGDTGWQYGGIGTNPAGGTPIAGTEGVGIFDPQGNLHSVGGSYDEAYQDLLKRPASSMSYMKDVGTGEYENDPFGASFTDPYKKAYLDYQTKDLDKQYNKQLNEALYGFARTGTRGGTAYADTLADIGGINAEKVPYGEYGKNLIGIKSGGDKAVTDLRNMIQSQEKEATNQLYQTEDPEKAANAARQMAANIPATPNLSPLGDFFKPLVIGASGLYSGYQGQSDFNRYFGPKSPLDTKGSGQTSG